VSISVLIRSLAAMLRHPGRVTRRFLTMSLGIERRSRELSIHWTPHLEASKSAQARWSRDADGGCVSILGAGRLMDVNIEALALRFARLHLVDADPLAESFWKKQAQHQSSSWQLADVSGCFEAWSDAIEKTAGDWNGVLSAVRDLPMSVPQSWSCAADAIISLNLLSQIPVLWQDILEEILRRKFGREQVRRREEEWLSAIEIPARWLVEQHLAMIHRSGARRILIICDVEYAHYRGTESFPRSAYRPAPVRWDGIWMADSGVTVEIEPALYGIGPDSFPKWMPSYDLEWSESWLWHIAPQGLEETGCGMVHRVGAFAFRRTPVIP